MFTVGLSHLICCYDFEGRTETNKKIGTTCQLQSSATASSSPWIAAWNQGSALNTNSLSASINIHSAYTTLTFDLTQAALTADSNPFVAAASGTGSGTTTSGDDNKGGSGSDDNPSSSGSNSGATVAISGAQKKAQDRQRAHGILMGIAVVILFPLGTIFMRLVGHPWIHAGIQVVSLILMIAGMAIGIILVDDAEMVILIACSFCLMAELTKLIGFHRGPFRDWVHSRGPPCPPTVLRSCASLFV